MQLREIQPGETGSAFLAIKELRTRLSDEAEFVRVVDEVQRPEGWAPPCSWLAREAGRLGCDHLSLDPAVGPERADAHRPKVVGRRS